MTLEIIEPAQHERHKYIGGSDVAAILGLSPWRTLAELWADKITPPAPEAATRNHQAKQRGSRLEPYIRDMAAQEFGFEYAAVNTRYVDESVPFFAAEIDAELTDGSNVEIKTVHPFRSKDWGEEDTDNLPLHYIAQVQWGMGVRRREHCHVLALIGDDLRHYEVHADADLIGFMRKAAQAFWTDFVLPKVQPPIDYDDAATALRTVQRLYPGTNGQRLVATPMHEHWRAVWEDARLQRDHYDAVCDGAKAHLLHEMGNAALLAFPDGKALRRALQDRKGYTVEATKVLDTRWINDKESSK